MLWLGLAPWWKDINKQGVTERRRQTSGTSFTYQTRKNVHINMCSGTFNLWVIAEAMRDGAPAHFSCAVWDVLSKTYHDWWIGTGGPTAWTPPLRDLNPLDFYWWRHLNTVEYAALHRRIMDACQTIHNYHGISERMPGSMMRCVEACIEISWREFWALIINVLFQL
jgi:hypothetical protein